MPRRTSTRRSISIPGGKGVGEIAHGSVLRHWRYPRHPEEEMGADRAGRSRTRQAADQEPATSSSSTPAGIADIPTARNISAMRRALSKACGGMAGQKEGQDGRRRHRDCVDHPLATSLGPHRNGPQIKYLLPGIQGGDRPRGDQGFSRMESGAPRRCSKPAFRPSRTSAAISTKLTGKRCTFQGFPWKWRRGRCLRHPPRRHVRSKRQVLRLERGGASRSASAASKSAQASAQTRKKPAILRPQPQWGHGMPQWPSRANLNVRVVEFHAKDGLLVQQFEGIMHRGTHMDAPIHVAREPADR